MIRKIYIAITFAILLISCASTDKTYTDTLKNDILKTNQNLQIINTKIDKYLSQFDTNKDLELIISADVINKIFSKLSKFQTKDIIISVLPTTEILKKEESFLGIKYKNYVNIDTGFIKIDIKSLKIIGLVKNKLNLLLELQGTGFIELSGKNTGIPASINSKIKAYTKDTISFQLYSKFDKMILNPRKNIVELKTKFTINLFGWNIPWKENFGLNLSELISPIEIPLNISPEIILPLPNNKTNKMKMKHIPIKIKTQDFNISSNKNSLKISTNIKVIKK